MLGIFWGLTFRRSNRLLYQVGSINGLKKQSFFGAYILPARFDRPKLVTPRGRDYNVSYIYTRSKFRFIINLHFGLNPSRICFIHLVSSRKFENYLRMAHLIRLSCTLIGLFTRHATYHYVQ